MARYIWGSKRLLQTIKVLILSANSGFCLGENHWCEYIEGDTTFICVIAGFNAAELTPKYPDFISERVYVLHVTARWWYEYRNEVLLLKDV